MTTVRKIITNALNRLAVTSANSVPTDEETSICLGALNSLIDSLSNSILNIHTINPYRFTIDANKGKYTLGPALDDNGDPTGADWVIPRPMRIEQAVLMVYPAYTIDPETGQEVIGQTTGTLFLPLQKLNFSQYSSLTVRALETTWPTTVYDNNGYPLRTLEFWPIPQMSLACELWLWEPLATYASLDDELNLPPGYERYLTLKLALEVAPDFSKVVTDTLRATLAEAENNVKVLNQMPTYGRPTTLGRALSSRTGSYVIGDSQQNRIPRIW